MSVVEKNAIYKIQWQITGQDDKSGEIRLENKMCCLAVRSFSSFHQILYLVCKSADAYSATEISEVFFSTCSTPLDQRKQMIQKTGDRSHQIFSYEIITEWKTPLTLTLWVTIRESVDGYSFRLGDSLLTDQLWKSAKSQQFTDVEFRVRLAGTSSSEGTSYKSFTAHRCILAARSPVLAAIVGKSDSSTVDVDNVDPAAFRDLLHFIYTGQLDATSSNISQLQSLADRYEIPTLQKLLRTPVKELNASELTSLIMSSQPFFYPDINTKQDLNSSQGRSPMLLFGPEIHSTGIGSPADDGKHVLYNQFSSCRIKDFAKYCLLTYLGGYPTLRSRHREKDCVHIYVSSTEIQ